ncbi:Os01g0247600 [Oryza sativa Japonica Group]|jgi:hypothetical protein|uniref:Os01g0247600 protein n=2 Tax=Oryza sativa subsp. japonica TaxID=39947 RepID=Q0JP35_ORYSJ|nr:hypothetical protein EE612_001444 [Oryza sativa]KAF2949384.1 hypothetical protein DAI22_01g102600 [Oryza sativa Japonica Group]BAF04493.1 Os01g0247600 [Oryza sativa Japonica Group]BAG98863.1 unnamed protein product [Oryza sativa Japonica Group]BAS71321.1 Os01g0247600 [Oryza sativa Japonica Group]|eukprot:NP_001042579.1 Os01g0247600 [Oryza sativa Japonica Group]
MTATTVAKSSEEVPPARGLPLYLHPPFPHGPERKGEGAGLGCGGRAAHDDRYIVFSPILRLILSVVTFLFSIRVFGSQDFAFFFSVRLPMWCSVGVLHRWTATRRLPSPRGGSVHARCSPFRNLVEMSGSMFLFFPSGCS